MTKATVQALIRDAIAEFVLNEPDPRQPWLDEDRKTSLSDAIVQALIDNTDLDITEK